MDEGDDVHLIFLDFAKAFNAVMHSLLSYNFTVYGLYSNAIGWIHDFLPNRNFFVNTINAEKQTYN